MYACCKTEVDIVFFEVQSDSGTKAQSFFSEIKKCLSILILNFQRNKNHKKTPSDDGV